MIFLYYYTEQSGGHAFWSKRIFAKTDTIAKRMLMTSKKLPVGLAGMAGSGKSIVVKTAIQNGYDVIVMGDEVRDEAKKRNIAPSPENLGEIMLELRRVEGESVIARRCMARINKATSQKIIIDGVRSPSEAEEFRKTFPNFSLIAVHSSPEARFKRIHNRQRSDDPKDWPTFHERDMRELSVGLGNVIAMAEYIIVNEGTRGLAKTQARRILKKVERKWMK